MPRHPHARRLAWLAAFAAFLLLAVAPPRPAAADQVPAVVDPATPTAPAAIVEADSPGEVIATPAPNATVQRTDLESRVNDAFGSIVGHMATVLFWKIPVVGMPFIVAWLVAGALFFTLRMGFVNLRAFRHAIQVLRGRYDDPSAPGEVTHFQALSSALSATVGLGNIAGVAVAVSKGGPGAVFWMLVAAFLGMTAKFVECTLGLKYRTVDERGHVIGGPMRYLSVGLEQRGLGWLGRILAPMFMVFAIGGSFGGGNMFQANQAFRQVNDIAGGSVPPFLFGIVMALLVGIVILGGIRRIATTAEKIVPLMCLLYVACAMFIVVWNIDLVPYAILHIVQDAFQPQAIEGGVLGVLVIGFQRAAFSNEAGVGSAAIAHSAAKTSEPVREGIVALLEPFIDTIVVCFATGIVIVLYIGWLDDHGGDFASSMAAIRQVADGTVLTARAFGTVIGWFPYFLTIAVLLFAYSTMISWSYYGERCWVSFFGVRSSVIYRLIFLGFIVLGCVSDLGAVIDFSDLMILSMAFPNILGCALLSGEVRKDLNDYLQRLRNGEFPEKNA